MYSYSMCVRPLLQGERQGGNVRRRARDATQCHLRGREARHLGRAHRGKNGGGGQELSPQHSRRATR